MLVKRKNFTRLNSKFNKRSKRSKRNKRNKINRKSRKNRKLKGGRSKEKKAKFTIKRGGSSVAISQKLESPGDYLIREPTKRQTPNHKYTLDNHKYTLEVMFDQNKILKYKILQDGSSSYYLHSSKDKKENTIDDLITHYKNNPLKATNNYGAGFEKKTLLLTKNVDEHETPGASVARSTEASTAAASTLQASIEASTLQASTASKQRALAAKPTQDMFNEWEKTHNYKYNDLFKLYEYKIFKDAAEKCKSTKVISTDVEHRTRWSHNLIEYLKKTDETTDRHNFVRACIKTLTKEKGLPEQYFIIFIRNRDVQQTQGIEDYNFYKIGEVTYILSGSIALYHKTSTNLNHRGTYKIGNTIDRNTTTDQSGLICLWKNKKRPWVMHGVVNPQENLSDHIDHLKEKHGIAEIPIYIVVKK
jgi:hypothetical protein